MLCRFIVTVTGLGSYCRVSRTVTPASENGACSGSPVRWGGCLCPRTVGVALKFLCKFVSHLYAAAAAAKSLQSCPTLCNPIDGSPPGSPVPGILQARTLEWVAISFSNA